MNIARISKIILTVGGLLLLGAGCSGAPAPRTKSATEKPPEQVQENKADENMPAETSAIKARRTLAGQEDLFAKYNGAILKTSQGDIALSFYEESPITVNNFLNLAQSGFYNGTTFHRVIPNFMIQGGDPNSRDTNRALHGKGGPEYRFEDEFNNHPIVLGSLAMANSGRNTNGSQFFIVTAGATPWLNGKHTNFGYVKEGIDVAQAIQSVPADDKNNPLEPITILSLELLTR